MWWRKVLVVAGLIPIAAVGGLVVLFIGMKGAANYAESTCHADVDARPGYGGWSMAAELWPPSFTCEISGTDVPILTIAHPSVGVVGFVGTVVIPAIYVACVVTLLWLFARRSVRRTGQSVG